MDRQPSFSDIEFAGKKKMTRREAFLKKMEALIPWVKWVKIIEGIYPKGERGRPPIGAEKMLRMYLLQIWFNLSDEGIEDALYDIQSMRQFVGINLLTEDVPDATTLLKFRHLLESNGIARQLFNDLGQELVRSGRWCGVERSWMRPSLTRRAQPRTRRKNGIRRCTRPGKATNGILG